MFDLYYVNRSTWLKKQNSLLHNFSLDLPISLNYFLFEVSNNVLICMNSFNEVNVLSKHRLICVYSSCHNDTRFMIC